MFGDDITWPQSEANLIAILKAMLTAVIYNGPVRVKEQNGSPKLTSLQSTPLPQAKPPPPPRTLSAPARPRPLSLVQVALRGRLREAAAASEETVASSGLALVPRGTDRASGLPRSRGGTESGGWSWQSPSVSVLTTESRASLASRLGEHELPA